MSEVISVDVEGCRVLYDMPESEYHAIEDVGSSGVKQVLRSPMHYHMGLRSPMKATDSMLLGSVVHAATLDNSVDRQFAAYNGPARTTKAGKAAYADFVEANAGKTVVKQELIDKADAIAQCLRDKKVVCDLLSDGNAEVSAFYEMDGINCKNRYDYCKEGVIVDLKTTSAPATDFARQAINYGYEVQAGHYALGFQKVFRTSKLPEFYFIVVETTPPFESMVFKADEEFIAAGIAKCRQAYRILESCQVTDHFPGYTQEIQTLSLPVWAKERS